MNSHKVETCQCDDCKDERRVRWLEANDYQESDVLTDDEGREYVISLNENGNPNEDGYDVREEKLYLEY